MCPICSGQLQPDHVLSEMQRRIFNALQYGPRPRTYLEDVMYRDDPDGGPLDASNQFHRRVQGINRRLKSYGIVVRCVTGQGGQGDPFYHIRRV